MTPPAPLSVHLNFALSRIFLVLAGLPPASLGAASATAAATAAAASTAAMNMTLAGIPGEAVRWRCKSRGWLVCEAAGEGTATAQLEPRLGLCITSAREGLGVGGRHLHSLCWFLGSQNWRRI